MLGHDSHRGQGQDVPDILKKLRKLFQDQMFDIAIQAGPIGNQIIARSTISNFVKT